MITKVTAIAPSNIAFIKYWGKKVPYELNIPANSSISMNLSDLLTTTTVEFNSKFSKDSVIINDERMEGESDRVIKHLDRIRVLAKIKDRAKVVSKNNFPTGTGLSSSASGFAALTLAGVKAAGLKLSEKELSILSREGSGSSCRSIPDGFVEWLDGNTNETSHAVSIYPENYWDIVDVVVIVSKDKKHISSTEGHKFAMTSPFFQTRLKNVNDKIKLIKKYMKEKDFERFGELIEQEALELHAIYLTSKPSLIYLLPASLLLMHMVKKWRQDGLPVYFTLNTGQDVHLICQKKDAARLSKLAGGIKEVQKTIINYPSKGARLSDNHLF